MAAIVKGVDWLSLLPEMMDLIVKMIDGYRDFIVFGSVCKFFNFATASVKHPESPPSFPLLMLADGTEWEDEQPQLNQIIPPPRCFHDIFHSTTLDVNIPEAYGRLCLGTKFGWLLTLNRDQEINLLHPFSKRQINLPNIHPGFNEEIFPFYFPFSINKACVSCLPADRKNCIVFVIFTDTGKVAFARVGDDSDSEWSWRVVNLNTQGGGLEDIIYHKGLLYAVNFQGVVFRSSYINKNEEFSNGAPIAPPPPEIKWTFRRYLVEMDDDLLLVVRVHQSPFPFFIWCTDDFVIYRMEEAEVDDEASSEEYPNKWVKVESLGNRALFLGASASVSQPSVGDHSFIKGNCIYFTDEHSDNYSPQGYGGYDSGIFHVEDKSIERHYTDPSGFDYRTHVWYI